MILLAGLEKQPRRAVGATLKEHERIGFFSTGEQHHHLTTVDITESRQLVASDFARVRRLSLVLTQSKSDMFHPVSSCGLISSGIPMISISNSSILALSSSDSLVSRNIDDLLTSSRIFSRLRLR